MIHVVRSDSVGETLYTTRLPNGLQLVVMPRLGLQQTYGAYTVKYGGVHRHAVQLQGEVVTIPDGVAHFLEHMMFARPDGEDPYRAFQERGATISAYTTSSLTSFYFACIDQVEQNLAALLEMVQKPYFSAELVEAERQVIAQEIHLFAGETESQVQIGLMRGLYGADHPLANDLLGTEESIGNITPEMLFYCHEFYYHPSNSILLVIGDVNSHSLIEFVRQHQIGQSFGKRSLKDVRRFVLSECPEIHQELVVQETELDIPLMMVGYKERLTGRTAKELLRIDQATQLGLEAVVGRGSTLHGELLEASLVDDELYWNVEYTECFGYACIGAVTSEPHQVREKIERALQEACTGGITEEAFQRARQKLFARFLSEFDDFYALGMRMSNNLVRRFTDLEVESMLRSLTIADVNQRLRELVQDDGRTVSVLQPKSLSHK